jgi:hypothetical protein
VGRQRQQLRPGHRAQRRLKFFLSPNLDRQRRSLSALDGGAIATLLQFGHAARVFDINARAIQHHHIEGIGSGAQQVETAP